MAPQLIIDGKGRKTGVLLSIKDYTKLQEMAEELSDIKAYDKAKSGLHKQQLFPLREIIKQRKQVRTNGK